MKRSIFFEAEALSEPGVSPQDVKVWSIYIGLIFITTVLGAAILFLDSPFVKIILGWVIFLLPASSLYFVMRDLASCDEYVQHVTYKSAAWGSWAGLLFAIAYILFALIIGDLNSKTGFNLFMVVLWAPYFVGIMIWSSLRQVMQKSAQVSE